MDPHLNPYQAVSDAPNERPSRNTPAEKTATMAAIRRFAPDPDAALIALAACGLTDPYQPLPGITDAANSTRRHPNAATHGCRAGVAWHREHRIALCRPCKSWLGATERIAAAKVEG